jgi:hypothetical protein
VGWFPPLREGNLKEGGKYELWLHDWYKTRPSPTVWERGLYADPFGVQKHQLQRQAEAPLPYSIAPSPAGREREAPDF